MLYWRASGPWLRYCEHQKPQGGQLARFLHVCIFRALSFVVGLVLGVALATGETIAQRTKIASKICQYLKNKFQLYACQPTKPLKFKRFPQSQARGKSHGQRQLSTHETSKPPRCQTSKRPVIPYKVKEGSKVERQDRSETHWEIHSLT